MLEFPELPDPKTATFDDLFAIIKRIAEIIGLDRVHTTSTGTPGYEILEYSPASAKLHVNDPGYVFDVSVISQIEEGNVHRIFFVFLRQEHPERYSVEIRSGTFLPKGTIITFHSWEEGFEDMLEVLIKTLESLSTPTSIASAARVKELLENFRFGPPSSDRPTLVN